jgi:LacI family transcriptional regulator
VAAFFIGRANAKKRTDVHRRGRFGKHEQHRQYHCDACRARFSGRKGTPLYRCHLPESTDASVLDHLAEGNGIRQTGRFLGVHRNTVLRLARAAGRHAREGLVAFSPSDARGPVRREVGLRR